MIDNRDALSRLVHVRRVWFTDSEMRNPIRRNTGVQRHAPPPRAPRRAVLNDTPSAIRIGRGLTGHGTADA